jgi:signal peptidase I
MKGRALSLTLAAPLVLALAGCGPALKRIYTAAVYKVARVPTEGMLPTIKPGDYISYDEGYYKGHPFERFDLVVFSLAPENVPAGLEAGVDTKTILVKRVTALGGETVEVKAGTVYVNDVPLVEPFETVRLGPRDRFGPVKVPEGELFLMGDNRPNSMDSRHWARPTLPVSFVRGKVVEIFHE